MDLNRVAVFARVVETQGFTAAARALRLPKSSVSRSVKQLEDDLGVRLLQRTTRQVRLTDAGRAYYEQASRALASLDEARDAVSDAEGAPRGAIKLTAPVDMGVFLLAPIITEFVRRFPQVRVEAMLTNRVVDLVQEGVDLGVRMGRLADSSLVARPLAPLEAGLFASGDYLDARSTPKRPTDLESHDCVLFKSSTGRSRWSLQSGTSSATVEVRGAFAADDFFFVHEAIRSGAGIGILPLYLGLADSRLVRVLPEHSIRGGRGHVVYPSARHVPRRVVLLRDAIVEGVTHRCERSGHPGQCPTRR